MQENTWTIDEYWRKIIIVQGASVGLDSLVPKILNMTKKWTVQPENPFEDTMFYRQFELVTFKKGAQSCGPVTGIGFCNWRKLLHSFAFVKKKAMHSCGLLTEFPFWMWLFQMVNKTRYLQMNIPPEQFVRFLVRSSSFCERGNQVYNCPIIQCSIILL
jgi:hypothetical protein